MVREVLNDVFVEAGFVVPADNDVLYTLGIDSLELVQMCQDLDEKLHIEIDVRKLDQVKTMFDLLRLVKAYVRVRGHVPAPYCAKKDCICGFSEVFWEDPISAVPKELGLL